MEAKTEREMELETELIEERAKTEALLKTVENCLKRLNAVQLQFDEERAFLRLAIARATP